MTSIGPHKRIRLSAEVYAQRGRVASITIATHARQAFFSNPDLAQAVVETLISYSSSTGVRVHAYCVMPDHVHLLLEPGESCDLITFVGRFKNLAQRAIWTLDVRGLIWQKRFYDHFLRTDEDLHTAVRYVLQNPERAGLVKQW